MARKNSNSNKKSGGAGFLITFLIFALIGKGSIFGIILGLMLGLAIGKVTSIMGSGLDTTTHNRRDRAREQEEAEKARLAEEENRRRMAEEAERKRREEASKIPLTGDKLADQVILCEQIFRTVSESPAKAPQVRKFMNYYLPTTLKMLANYRQMEQRGVSYGGMKEAREITVKGMNLVLTACQKLIDNLHRDNMLDISTDIDVLEQMLKRDGYTENEILETARTAAEAQMRASSAPVMDFPVEEPSPTEQPSVSNYSVQQE